MEKWWKQTDQALWVTITDVINSESIEHNYLNWCSSRGLLVKWGINPSTSLKCMMTERGKLLSAGLFVYLLPTRLPNLPCGKALIKKVLGLVSCDYPHNYVMYTYKKSQTMSGHTGLQYNDMKWFSIWSWTKPGDFGNSVYSECNIPAKQQTHQSIYFQLWHLGAMEHRHFCTSRFRWIEKMWLR